MGIIRTLVGCISWEIALDSMLTAKLRVSPPTPARLIETVRAETYQKLPRICCSTAKLAVKTAAKTYAQPSHPLLISIWLFSVAMRHL